MGFELGPRLDDGTRKAAADLSAAANQYKFVNLDGDGNVVLANAAGEPCYGVLQNKPGLNQTAVVTVTGVSKLQADGNINAGDLIACSADGQAKVAAPGETDTTTPADALVGSFVMGMALEDAAAGDIFAANIQLIGAVPTTAA